MFKNLSKRAVVAMAAVALFTTALLSPAGAANTAYEHRVDTDDDGIADSREFAGSDRYATAALLADRYVAEHGDADTVIVASGVSQVDAVAAAALSGTELAPVLLTHPDRLTAVTAAWIDRNDILDVIIVGGPAAVSETVETALADVGIVDTVRRINGADRYETAALIADETGAGAWCGSPENTAFVVSGTDIAAAAIVAPASAAMGVPVLLADNATGLPAVTVDALGDLDVERAVHVSTNGSQPTVEAALADQVGTVVSIAATAAVASAEFAELLVTDCADESNVNLTAAALTTNPVDALAAALTLSDFAQDDDSDGGIVPVLFGDKLLGLDGVVGDWLEDTPNVIDDKRTHFAVIALGGTAAVPAWLVDDAVFAAASTAALTASITDTMIGEDDMNGTFIVEFSEPVSVEAAKSSLAELIAVNGVPIAGTPDTVTIAGSDADDVDDPYAVCEVTADSPVASRFLVSNVDFGDRDQITVAPSAAVLLGTAGDKRQIASVTHTVRAERTERLTVSAQIMRIPADDPADGYAGATLYVDVNKPGILNADKITVTDTDGTESTLLSADITATVDSETGLVDRIEVEVTSGWKSVKLESGAFTADGAESRALTPRYLTPNAKGFKATAVSAEIVHTAPAKAVLGGVTLAAVKGSDADGAHGNDWTVESFTPTGYDADSDTVDVAVSADPRHQRIVVRFNSGTPTVAQVVEAFDAAKNLNGLIAAHACGDSSDAVSEADIDAVTNGKLGGGMSDVVFAVKFSDEVEEETSGANPSLVSALDDLLDGDADTALDPVGELMHSPPDSTVTVKFTNVSVENLAMLAKARSVDIPAGVVDGYATDPDTTDDVDEDKNLVSDAVRVRIR